MTRPDPPRSRPEPLPHTGHLIRRVQQLHAALWSREVSTKVSSVQYAALVILEERPGISQRDLGEQLDLDRSTIADLVNRMTARGLIRREQSTEDRRRKVLDLTDEGARTLRAMHPDVDRVQELLTGGLSSAELSTLRHLLREVLAHGIANGHLHGRIPAPDDAE